MKVHIITKEQGKHDTTTTVIGVFSSKKKAGDALAELEREKIYYTTIYKRKRISMNMPKSKLADALEHNSVAYGYDNVFYDLISLEVNKTI